MPIGMAASALAAMICAARTGVPRQPIEAAMLPRERHRGRERRRRRRHRTALRGQAGERAPVAAGAPGSARGTSLA